MSTMWNRTLGIFVLMLMVFGSTVGIAHAQDATAVANATIAISGQVVAPADLALDDVQSLSSQTIDVTFQSGQGEQNHSFTGVLLWDVLQQVGIATDEEIKNDILSYYAIVTANDGYRVVFSLGEIDPQFGNNPYLLAWDQDGAPLEGDSGPFRIVVPGDVHGGRYVSGVVSIEIHNLAS